MAKNTKFNIDLDTGNFMVASDEVIYENMNDRIPKVVETYSFESEWDFENNLLKFRMDGKDAFPILEDTMSPIFEIANRAKEHHLSVMRYERM